MASDNSWSLTQPYFISTKTYATQLGNTTHVIVFMGYEIVNSAHAPYFSITREYADNGGGSRDSIDFLWNGAANPGGGYSDWVKRGGIEALRDSLHAKGKKILICLQAVNASVGLNYVLTDSARTEVFTKAVAGYVNRHNFDGADLNVENSQTYSRDQLVRFFRILRRNMPSPKLITAVPPPSDFSNYAPAMNYIDYVLPQFYNWPFTIAWNSSVNSNQLFLKAPLHRNPLPSGSSELQDLNTYGPDKWYNAGWPKSKIVLLLSNEANPYSGSDALYASCPGTYFWADTAAYWFLSHGGTYTWDDTHVGGYIHGTATASFGMNGFTISSGQKFIIPVLSDRNIDSVVAWAKTKGYNNFGLYDVSTDTRTPATVKTPRHAHLSSLLNTGQLQAPTGTFSASPSSLPVGGGTVTLSWTSTGADSARISPGVGIVATRGTQQVNVVATTTFTLTFSNQAGSTQYSASVTVALPGGQGPQDITIQATSPIALITHPSGSGNSNIEVIRDGDLPPVGSSDPMRQFDTYNGGGVRSLDWIGYAYPTNHAFSALLFQEGLHVPSGGWFTSIMVQVRVNGTWTDVQNLQCTPPYVGANGVNYDTYDLSFIPLSGDAIRIAGAPGGTGHFISVGELRAFEPASTEVEPGPHAPHEFALQQNYPNPFNPTTKIGFSLPAAAHVSLNVYNILGQEVSTLVDEFLGAGHHSVDFSGDLLPNGVYFYRLKANNYSEMKKMILLR